jgi:hypothetical protein
MRRKKLCVPFKQVLDSNYHSMVLEKAIEAITSYHRSYPSSKFYIIFMLELRRDH